MNLAAAQFLDELAPYLKLDFFVANQAGQDLDGNAILYTGVAQAIKAQYDTPTNEDYFWLNNLYALSMKSPGLITRGPHKFNDHQSHDDYVGLCYFSLKVNPWVARAVYCHGKANGFIYDNSGRSAQGLKMKLSCWHRRFPGQVEHYKICAELKLNLFDRIWWSIGMIPYGVSESGHQMKWLKYRAYKESKQKYFLCDIACRLWENYIRKKYMNLMGDVFKVYYGERHIFTCWMNGRI